MKKNNAIFTISTEMATFGTQIVHSGIAFFLFGTSIHGKPKKLQCNGSILSQRCAFVHRITLVSKFTFLVPKKAQCNEPVPVS